MGSHGRGNGARNKERELLPREEGRDKKGRQRRSERGWSTLRVIKREPPLPCRLYISTLTLYTPLASKEYHAFVCAVVKTHTTLTWLVPGRGRAQSDAAWRRRREVAATSLTTSSANHRRQRKPLLRLARSWTRSEEHREEHLKRPPEDFLASDVQTLRHSRYPSCCVSSSCFSRPESRLTYGRHTSLDRVLSLTLFLCRASSSRFFFSFPGRAFFPVLSVPRVLPHFRLSLDPLHLSSSSEMRRALLSTTRRTKGTERIRCCERHS